MGTLSIRLPNSPHQRLAEREGISINQLVSSALAEKLSALDAERYLRERADVVAALRSMPSFPRCPMWKGCDGLSLD
jgi:hypothetical protein